MAAATRTLSIGTANPSNRHTQHELGAAAFSTFKIGIGALKKGGGDALEKLANLIATATLQKIAPANTS